MLFPTPAAKLMLWVLSSSIDVDLCLSPAFLLPVDGLKAYLVLSIATRDTHLVPTDD